MLFELFFYLCYHIKGNLQNYYITGLLGSAITLRDSLHTSPPKQYITHLYCTYIFNFLRLKSLHILRIALWPILRCQMPRKVMRELKI